MNSRLITLQSGGLLGVKTDNITSPHGKHCLSKYQSNEEHILGTYLKPFSLNFAESLFQPSSSFDVSEASSNAISQKI